MKENTDKLRKQIRGELEDINEELTLSYDDAKFIRELIRKEVAIIFYDLWRKRSTWKKG